MSGQETQLVGQDAVGPAPTNFGGLFGVRLVGAMMIWSSGLLAVNITPLLFQAIEGKGALDQSHLGALGASLVLGMALLTGISPLWIERVNWRWVSIGGLGMASACVLVVSFASDFTVLVSCFFLLGAASGVVQTPAFAMLGRAHDSVRTFSIALFASMLLPAILSLALPADFARIEGGVRLLAIIAIIFLAMVPLAWVLPGKQLGSAAEIVDDALPSDPLTGVGIRLRDYGAATAAPIAASVAGGVFTGVIMAIYNFVGSISVANGLSSSLIGTLVGLGLIGALVGALIPSIVEKWIKPTKSLGISMVALVLTYPALLSTSPQIFTIAFILHCVFGTAGFAYFLAMVRSIDLTHRIYVGYPAMQSAGIAGATAAAGVLLTNFNPLTLLSFAAFSLLVSWVIWLLALRLSDRFSGVGLNPDLKAGPLISETI